MLGFFEQNTSQLQLPSQCAVCRQWGRSAVCGHCISRFAAPQPRCARCGLRLGVATKTCGNCLREPPPFAHTVCATDYGFPWSDLISAFKFHGHVELAPALALMLSDAVRAAAQPFPHIVVPVPLSNSRLEERGYNQAWELARRCSRSLGLEANAQLLMRHLDTAHQVDLTRSERQRNLRNAFMVNPPQRTRLVGQHVALVDDVMTTGATLRECSAALLRAGAATVDVWVLARTPPD
jgi:ComF family protein